MARLLKEVRKVQLRGEWGRVPSSSLPFPFLFKTPGSSKECMYHLSAQSSSELHACLWAAYWVSLYSRDKHPTPCKTHSGTLDSSPLDGFFRTCVG